MHDLSSFEALTPQCVCGGTGYRPVISGAWSRTEGAPVRFQAAACETCGLVRTFPVPNEHQYASDTFEFCGEPEDSWSGRIAEYVARYSEGPRLLDVGCHVGNLVAAARERGLQAEGVDVDPRAIAQGRSLGRPVSQMPVDALSGEYDAVVLNHVLEHVVDLTAFLRSVEELLAPRGLLFVFVPHYRGLVPRLMGENWYGWLPNQHVWHFTPSTLVGTAERTTALRPRSLTTRGAIEPASRGAKGLAKRVVARASQSVAMGDQIEAIFECPRSRAA
jgi:SAM-dependent methyltransferase